MSTSTKETQAANAANSIIALLAAAGGLSQQIDALNAQITNTQIATLIAAFPTAAVTSTGGLGTADTNPVAANPVNTGINPGSLLSRAVSLNDLTTGLAALSRLSTAIKGSTVAADATVVPLIYKMIG